MHFETKILYEGRKQQFSFWSFWLFFILLTIGGILIMIGVIDYFMNKKGYSNLITLITIGLVMIAIGIAIQKIFEKREKVGKIYENGILLSSSSSKEQEFISFSQIKNIYLGVSTRLKLHSRYGREPITYEDNAIADLIQRYTGKEDNWIRFVGNNFSIWIETYDNKKFCLDFVGDEEIKEPIKNKKSKVINVSMREYEKVMKIIKEVFSKMNKPLQVDVPKIDENVIKKAKGENTGLYGMIAFSIGFAGVFIVLFLLGIFVWPFIHRFYDNMYLDCFTLTIFLLLFELFVFRFYLKKSSECDNARTILFRNKQFQGEREIK